MMPHRLMLVEDFEAFRLLVLSVLEERKDFCVIGEAADGLEALQKIEELQPDLVLLDIGLAGLDGIQVAERAQVIAPHTRTLFISVESASDIIDETFRLGGKGYVHKPRVRIDLLPAIEAVFAGNLFVSSSLEFTLVGKVSSHNTRRDTCLP